VGGGMQPATTPTLHISLQRSYRLLLVQWLAHGVAVFAVLCADIPDGFIWLLLVLVAASLLYQHRPMPVTGLILHGDGRIEKVGADGTASTMTLHHPHCLCWRTVLPQKTCASCGYTCAGVQRIHWRLTEKSAQKSALTRRRTGMAFEPD